MASTFEDMFDMAFDVLADVEGITATFTHVASGVSYSVAVIFNEFVGAIDDFGRAIFTAEDSFSSAPVRGDHFVLAGETKRWYLTDVRDDKSGGYELRCDITLEET